MKLQTKLNLKAQGDNQIDYHSAIAALGSCFVENIGDKLQYFRFKNFLNPFGIIFNPVSIERLIVRSINNVVFTDRDVFNFNELWHCSESHSRMSATSKEELLNRLNAAQLEANTFLESSSHLIITLGTAWVYRDLKENKIVANCHKRPQKEFEKHLLTSEEIENSLINITKSISTFNPNCSIIFTVSPVRHLKDGFVENSISKAHLISALHSVLNSSHNTYYFPSYEIMMDELRDYRFYDRDMLHPNQLAVDYIWDRFKEVWISKESENLMEKIRVIQLGKSHRPKDPDSNSYKNHLLKISELETQLSSRYPHISY